MTKIIIAVFISLALFISFAEGGRMMDYFMQTMSDVAPPPGDDNILWDASGDKILWDASGDEMLWE